MKEASTFTPSCPITWLCSQAAEQRESCDSSPEDFQEAVDHSELRVTAVRPALPFSWQCGWEAVTHTPVKRAQYTTFLSVGNDSVQDSCSFMCVF